MPNVLILKCTNVFYIIVIFNITTKITFMIIKMQILKIDLLGVCIMSLATYLLIEYISLSVDELHTAWK